METWAAAGEGEGGGGGRGGAGAAAGPREGTLEIAVASASNLPNTQLFGRQDPHVELRVGGRVEKSRSCNDGGTRPVWNEIFTFGTKGDKRFTLLVWNSCWLRKDKLMYAPAEGCVCAPARCLTGGPYAPTHPTASGSGSAVVPISGVYAHGHEDLLVPLIPPGSRKSSGSVT